MGRSVSTPLDARHIMYVSWMPDEEAIEEELEHHDFDCEHDRQSYVNDVFVNDEWDYFLYDLVHHVLKPLAPSLDEADYWRDREDYVVAENELVSFGVSEYMGLAAVWAVVREDRWDYAGDKNLTGLAETWLDNVWSKVTDKYPERMELLGRFSNGEAVYQQAKGTDE